MAFVTDQNERPLYSSADVEDYFALLKPRVMSLVIFTAIVGLLVAPGAVHPLIGFTAILCIAIGAGASGALNMWYDADIDAVMSRTINRPIPAGKVTKQEALAFGLVLSVFSVLTLGLLVNWVAGGLLAFTIFFYAVIYTMWLKRWTPQNIVIGGAAGSFPPMIGWAAVTGTITIESVILFLIIFLWTPPHFWALALYKKGDYQEAGIPMLPNVSGERATQNQIFIYSLLLAAIALAPTFIGFASLAYGAAAALLSAGFVFYATKLWREKELVEMKKSARKLFAFSLVYLFAIFLVLAADIVATKMLGSMI